MQVTKPINKTEVEGKKQDAIKQAHNPSNPGYINHRNAQRTNKVDYNTFRKSEAERAELKRLKKSCTITGSNKLVFQF